jgi:signal transduction histidine kinase
MDPKSPISFRIGFAVIVLFLVLNGFISFRALNRVVSNENWVSHTHEVQRELAETLSAMKDAETGQRGYLLTQNEAYLDPYHDGQKNVEIHLEAVSRLVADNPAQVTRLAQLHSLIQRRLELLEQHIRIQRTQGPQALRDAFQTGDGKAEMDRLRSVVGTMSAEEQNYLLQREQDSAASIRNARISFAGASFLALVLVGLAYVFLSRELATRQRTALALREANESLEVRVTERTSELAQTNETLQLEIGERKKTQTQLREFASELKRSNRELEDFAFVASHDLQEPLRKIQAFSDRMRNRFGESLTAEGQDYLERMQGAAGRMHVLINDLLAFSRVRTKARTFDQVDLGRVAREVVGDLEVAIQQSGGRVEIGPLPTIAADPVQMRQLFQNLIGNALKFHRPQAPPVITIRSVIPAHPPAGAVNDFTGKKCQIEFADNGIGFEEKYLDRIFQPFQRLHPRGVFAGTGMGLAVCRRIVERHSGEITARSELDRGTVFVITLPLTQKTEAGN